MEMTMSENPETIISLIQKIDEFIKGNDFDNVREFLNDILFELAYSRVRVPKRIGYPSIPADQIVQNLIELRFSVHDYEIDIEGYRKYFRLAQYTQNYPHYYPDNVVEKSLEHYIAATLLKLDSKDIYIDIASQHSPTPLIYRNLFGAETFRQDLEYPPGFNGNQIGGDAAHMPVPDEFASKMALHCSFEHFEGNTDINFIREAARALKPGGSICIVPLYLALEYSIVTDPVVAVTQNVTFEDKAVVCCVKGYENRFGRFYNPDTLKSRIVNNLGNLELNIFRITNARFDPSCYVQFAAVITKPSDL